MTKERIVKELSKVREQLAGLQARERDLAEQLQMAEDAEKMKFIEKNKNLSGSADSVKQGQRRRNYASAERKRAERSSTIRRKGGLQP